MPRRAFSGFVIDRDVQVDAAMIIEMCQISLSLSRFSSRGRRVVAYRDQQLARVPMPSIRR